MIDTEALRNKLLQQAVRGQLSERMVTDTPVDRTLEPYAPTRDIVLPDIPHEWRYCKFDHVFINRDSERIPVSVAERKKRDKIYDYYGASGVIDKIDDYLFDERLLLIGEDGANLLSRSTPIAFIADGKYWVNNHAHVLQMRDCVLIEFAVIAINAMPLEPYVTGSAQPKLSQRMMNTIAVPIPPIEEQARIVQKLDDAFRILDAIDSLQNSFTSNVNALKERIAEAAIRGQLTEQLESDGTADALVKEINSKRLELQKAKVIKKAKSLAPVTEDEAPYDIPATWRWVRFGNIIALKSGQDLSASAFNTDERGIPYLTGASNVDNGGHLMINRWTTQPRSTAVRGDLLLTCKGTVGKMAFLDVDEAHIARQFMAITAIGFDSDYARIFMEAIIAGLKDKQKGLIPGIERNDVLNLCFPMPPLAEQRRIVERVDALLQALPNSEN